MPLNLISYLAAHNIKCLWFCFLCVSGSTLPHAQRRKEFPYFINLTRFFFPFNSLFAGWCGLNYKLSLLMGRWPSIHAYDWNCGNAHFGNVPFHTLSTVLFHQLWSNLFLHVFLLQTTRRSSWTIDLNERSDQFDTITEKKIECCSSRPFYDTTNCASLSRCPWSGHSVHQLDMLTRLGTLTSSAVGG